MSSFSNLFLKVEEIKPLEVECVCQSIYETCETQGVFECSRNTLLSIGKALQTFKWDPDLSNKFLKIRHNTFADCVMRAIDVPIRGTDYPLRNLGLDTDLTPDIYLGNNSGYEVFLEFFVSSDVETAYTNKCEKYSRFAKDKVVVYYIGYNSLQDDLFIDVGNLCVVDISDLDNQESVKGFKGLMRSLAPYSKYVKHSSVELPIQQLTEGFNYNLKQQDIFYNVVGDGFTHQKYLESYKMIKDKISAYPDDARCGVYYDIKNKKFYIGKGYYDTQWLLRNINDEEVFRNVVSYVNEDFDLSSVDEVQEDDFYGQGEHKLRIPRHTPQCECIEKADTPEKIYQEIDQVEHDGLYQKYLTVQDIKNTGETFLEFWKKECYSIDNIKIKTIFMLPIPDPDLLNFKVLDYKQWHFKMFLNSKFFEAASFAKPFKPHNSGNITDSDIDKMFIESRAIEDSICTVRRNLSDMLGRNKASYNMKVMSEEVKTLIGASRGKSWNVEDIVKSAVNKLNLHGLEVEYCRLVAKRVKYKRSMRRLMKDRVVRENMFQMNAQEYRLYKEEVRESFNSSATDAKRGQAMGLNGYAGLISFDDLERLIIDSWTWMVEKPNTDMDDWFSVNVDGSAFPNTVVGNEAKNYYSHYKLIHEKIKNTRIYRIILWLSNLARSIWAISTYKTSKKSVVVDSMGTKGSCLFVCSTGNIMKYKSSKAFKILIPVSQKILSLCGYNSIKGWEIARTPNSPVTFAISHWQYLKIQQLKFFMELPGRWLQTMSSIMCEYELYDLGNDLFRHLTFCMLNARRKTENLLHDMKYLTYNMFGCFGCYSELLNDKFFIPHDMWQRYIQEKFLKSIPSFMDSLDHSQLLLSTKTGNYPAYRLMHPLSSVDADLDIFNVFVYSSYCFPKGVFTEQTEQLINMESILNIHKMAEALLGSASDYESVKLKSDVPISKIYDNDLFYNSGVVSAVGLFCQHVLSTTKASMTIRDKWASIVNRDITDYANSHGLRGDDLSSRESWGKKGHEIMTGYLSTHTDAQILKELNTFVPETIADCNKMKWRVLSTRYTITDYAKENRLKQISFTNANKVQWGGSREIYIMTFTAKNIQWALEQLFAEVAKNLENELIHISSADRFSRLYDAIKNPPNGVRYYLTLDCRKWAPLSNLNKYIVFVNSMRGILPDEFMNDFNLFFHLYFKKRLYFKEKDYTLFMKRKGANVFRDFFKQDGCAYYIEMPYSFMMGMFNYLSSILHAMSQLYYIKNIIPMISKKHGCDIEMVMYAHSDDSGGFVEISGSMKPIEVLKDVLRTYETFQKCCNHMLSLKKCNVSVSYFEITSYCFMKTDPMPVLPKFMMNHQINLTTMGVVNDIRSIVSEVVEMIVNGASFETAFYKWLLLGNTYHKFCMGQSIDSMDTRISLKLGGFPLIHPYELIVNKNHAEEHWFHMFDDLTYDKNIQLLSEMGLVDEWGKNRGIECSLISMKNRSEDGRFAGYDILDDLPDETIPSGHYICYMKKMSKKYYSDTMWYSLHDVDGLYIQSALFNNSIAQRYKFLQTKMTLPNLRNKIRYLFSSLSVSKSIYHYNDCENNIMKQVNSNRRVTYNRSNVRPKPSVVLTNYNQWWRNNIRECKLMALIKMSPWMALLVGQPMEMYNCINSARSLEIHDILSTLSEEEPLTRLSVTTRHDTRRIDRFELITKWFFFNSMPKMVPEGVYTERAVYKIPGETCHPECIASLLFETVASNTVNDIHQIKLSYTEGGTTVMQPAVDWLRNNTSSDPIYKMVLGHPSSDWLNNVDFISLMSVQKGETGRYWVGRSTCICRISGREYKLKVNCGRIETVSCSSQYNFSSIMNDIAYLDKFGFSFTANLSPYKTKKVMRLSKEPGGMWKWSNENLALPYYTNIFVDETISTANTLTIKKAQNQIKSRFQYNEGKNTYKAYLLHKKPCQSCVKCCSCQDITFSTTTSKYTLDVSRRYLVSHWSQTETYKAVYNELKSNQDILSEETLYVGQPGTILSAIYEGESMASDVNYFTEYKGEYMLRSKSSVKIEPHIIDAVRSRLSEFVKFKLIAGRVDCTTDTRRVREIIEEFGLETFSAALVCLPAERTMDYYKPLAYEDYWYNNTEIIPDFMRDFLNYLSSSLVLQDGTKSSKIALLSEICNSIVYMVSVNYYLLVSNNYVHVPCTYPRLYHLLTMFKDVGEVNNTDISTRFYYDPVSIMGSLLGWQRYLLVYSYRRAAKLSPDHRQGYKRNYLGFIKKFKSFCLDNLQISIREQTSLVYKTLAAPVYNDDSADYNCKVYPLKGCYPEDLTCNPDYYNDQVMTRDKEDSYMTFGYNPDEKYDASNESIFLDEGTVKEIRLCDEEETSNWICLDPVKSIFERKKGKGMKPIKMTKKGFVMTDAIFFKYDDKDIMNVAEALNSKTDMEGTVYSVLEAYIKQSGGDIKLTDFTDGSMWHMSRLNALLSKFQLFSKVAGADGDITRLIEGDNYDRIATMIEQTGNKFLNEKAIAELEMISPGLVERMKTDRYQLTKEAKKRLSIIINATKFDSEEFKVTVQTILNSAILVSQYNEYCEQSEAAICNICTENGTQFIVDSNALREPDPSNLIYHRVELV